MAWKLPPLGRTCKICGMFVGGMVMCAFNWSAGWWQIRYVDDWLGRPCWGVTGFSSPRLGDVGRVLSQTSRARRCQTVGPGDDVTCVKAASHRSVISRARSVAAPPRRLAADVCRIHARSPSPWTSVYRLHAGDHKGRPYGRVTDVWLVLRRIDCPPRLDLVRRCVSNGPGEPFILIASGWGASP